MTKQEFEKKLIVGAQIRIGPQYVEQVGGFEVGEVITLINGYFENDNGLFVEDVECPAIKCGSLDDYDSIYHLFGNNFEHFYDCEILTS